LERAPELVRGDDPFGLGQQLLRFALTILVAALALHWAAQLVLDIWPVLAVSAGVVIALSLLGLGVGWWRRRQSRW
jgi:hypothetical protein